MSTCLRQIYIGLASWPESTFSEDFERYEGEGAYRFLLEIVCGLHSPILGENEVFGQFKTFLKGIDQEILGTSLATFFHDVFRDGKRIKALFFSRKPAQSYGGLIKRMLASGEELHLVGSGQLAKEIVNTVKKRNPIHLYCRSPHKIEQLIDQLTSLSPIHQIREPRGMLVVAAPINSTDLPDLGPDVRVIDLRAEGRHDPILQGEVMSLDHFFAEFQKHQEQLIELQTQVLEQIGQFASTSCRQKQHRPFGWEEICA